MQGPMVVPKKSFSEIDDEEICRIGYASKSIKRPSDIPCCPSNISKLIRFRPLWRVPHRPPRPLAATFQEGESAELSRRCPLNMIDLGFAEDDLILFPVGNPLLRPIGGIYRPF